MNHVKRTKFVIICICLILGFSQWTIAQSNPVRGKVIDGTTGEAIAGANVAQQGATVGTITDAEGNFSLNVPGNATLVVSFLGYLTQEVRVNNQSDLTVRLLEDLRALDEVIVTGYGTQRKATVTGAISTISNQEITVTKNENVVNQLAGKLPGLRITQRSAQPGSYNSVIDLRGYGEPLFVIDGVARDKAYFSRMDPEVIESITVLKDASAAIYGIKAAQGVLLVTTKSGTARDGKVDISYNGVVTFQQLLSVPDTYTPVEWRTKRNEGWFDDFNNNYWMTRTLNPTFSDEDLAAAATMETYDWFGKIFKEFAPQTQHNVSLDGGTESLRYYFNLGYLKQDGAYASGSLWSEKFNLQSNVDAKITKDLSLRVSLAATIDKTMLPEGNPWDNFKNAYLTLKEIPFYANDNPEYLNGYSPWNNEFTNLVGKMDSKYRGYVQRNGRIADGSIELKYNIPGIKGLTARAFYDYYLNFPNESNYSKMWQTYQYNAQTDTYAVAKLLNGPNSSITRGTNMDSSHDMQLGLNYNNRFGKHSIDGTFVFEEIYSQWEWFNATRWLLLNTEYLSGGDSDDMRNSAGGPTDRSQRAFIGRINYDFAGKYMIGLIGRYEANSRWPKDTRWGFFPSVSLAWRASEESFIKNNIPVLSNLKFRVSSGTVGDESNATDYPQIFVGYETNNQFGWIYSPGVATQGIRATAIPNPNKTWIKATLQNVGMDFGLFNEKLSGTVELFRRDRKGIMGDNLAVIPGTVGANLPQINLNDDRTFGWEVELKHQSRISEFDYFVTGQISFTRREWLFKEETPASNSYDQWRNRQSGRYYMDDLWWTRKSDFMFTSIEQIRNFTTYPIGQGTLPGSWAQEDWNGDGIVDGSDEQPLATKGLPYFYYGFALGGSYKNFDLLAQFQGAYKVYMQLSEVFTEALPFGGTQNSLNWYMDSWRPTDPKADLWSPSTEWIPGYYPYGNRGDMRDNSNGIMDASYLRLKTLELGYTVPNQLLAKVGLKNIRIFVNAYNVFTVSALDQSIDPELQSATSGAGGSAGGADAMYAYPNNKTYSVGLNVKF
ncbi:MAG: TonB-dependent receptor [Tannerella sp.]|jgi:TonB-linked SusC/RagA family outer membrane protein|nr:TonB-dependent receptor [Tannerella sp.]